MGEFDYDGATENSAPLGRAYKEEKCRPDFEGMIQREKEKVGLMQDLYESTKKIILSNHSFNLRESKLKDLMGSIHVRLLVASATIEKLIGEQENYEE